MGTHHEVRYERLYLKQPGTERVRKGAEGRVRYLLATGWRETERERLQDYISVKFERSGVVPLMTKLPKPEPPPARPPRQGFGGPGGPGRGGPRGGGGFGGPGGPPRGSAPRT